MCYVFGVCFGKVNGGAKQKKRVTAAAAAIVDAIFFLPSRLFCFVCRPFRALGFLLAFTTTTTKTSSTASALDAAERGQ